MKIFCVRFDIDTEPCIRRGVPSLLHFARSRRVRFTFFANMGVAVRRIENIYKVLFHGSPTTRPELTAAKLSARTKLGWRDYLRTAILNPVVGKGGSDVLRYARSCGHEVGLHGGCNHGAWQSSAREWDEWRVRSEVEWGMAALREAGIEDVRSFASPGWVHPPSLDAILPEYGVQTSADSHGPSTPLYRKGQAGMPGVLGTNLTGEPGGIGYIEHCVALGLSPLAAAERTLDLIRATGWGVMYDHPVFAGNRGMEHLSAIVDAVADEGFEFLRASDIAELGDRHGYDELTDTPDGQ